ncbi:MAG: hypothetical protein AAF601_04210 [Pseudomonadota bacterium]
MTGETPPNKGSQKPKAGAAQTREDRLKAALKANMGRRKAQAKARAQAAAAHPGAKDTEQDDG